MKCGHSGQQPGSSSKGSTLSLPVIQQVPLPTCSPKRTEHTGPHRDRSVGIPGMIPFTGDVQSRQNELVVIKIRGVVTLVGEVRTGAPSGRCEGSTLDLGGSYTSVCAHRRVRQPEFCVHLAFGHRVHCP